ncbi:FixH family protein [Roseivirga sp.]|uniref:FixH family protein n=1 Tax=Roseivirga sp. TaxID=1964215 RepID=UPI003B8E576D
MNWGNKIVVAFVGFVGVLFTMVYISLNTNFNLVEEDYYAKELAYEDQIQRIRNHNNLVEKPTFNINRSAFQLELAFPDVLVQKVVEGKVIFYRPNTAIYDKELPLKFDENGKFLIDVSSFPIGAWKLKINWADKEKEYYKEIAFVI